MTQTSREQARKSILALETMSEKVTLQSENGRRTRSEI